MANIQEIRRELDKDELDYPALAAKYGKAILPQLKAIVVEDVPRLASKAAYLAGLLAGDTSHEIVALAARSAHDVVRVSAAAAVSSLPTAQAVEITATLLQDADAGVRVRAAKSAVKIDDTALNALVRDLATQDSHIRTLVADPSDLTPGAKAQSPVAGRKRSGDMTEGAGKGTMPGVHASERADAGQDRAGDMTEGAATGRMPGVDVSQGAVAGPTGATDMTEGAATGRMPGVDTSDHAGGHTAGGDMTEGSATGRMPGVAVK